MPDRQHTTAATRRRRPTWLPRWRNKVITTDGWPTRNMGWTWHGKKVGWSLMLTRVERPTRD